MPDIKLVLGFDFGLKHIGIAIGYPALGMAQPLTSLTALRGGEPPWEEILRLLRTWSPDALIIGIPLNMDGTEQAITGPARYFAESLGHRFHLPVFPVDERLTTVEARARLFESGGQKALHKKAVNSVSAQLILETWLGAL